MQPAKTPFYKNTRVLIVLGAVAIIVLFVVVVAVLAVGNSKKEELTTAQPTAEETAAPATNDDVKQSMAVLDAAIKQSNTDNAAADAAIKDEGIVKVSE